MRVLRRNSEEVEKRVICKNCGTELAYFSKEISKETSKDIDGGTGITEYITCMVCHKRIILRCS